MNIIFETDRMLLRTLILKDVPFIYELNLDPDVVLYTLDPIVDIDHAKQVLEQIILPQYALYNYKCWPYI